VWSPASQADNVPLELACRVPSLELVRLAGQLRADPWGGGGFPSSRERPFRGGVSWTRMPCASGLPLAAWQGGVHSHRGLMLPLPRRAAFIGQHGGQGQRREAAEGGPRGPLEDRCYKAFCSDRALGSLLDVDVHAAVNRAPDAS